MTFVYDVESFSNFFSITYWSIDKEIQDQLYIYKDHNDYAKIVNLFTGNSDWWVGYNSTAFDDPLIQWMIDNYTELSGFATDVITNSIQDQASKIINDKYSKYKEVSFRRFDLMRINYLYKSLKMVAVNLKHDKIQDLPYGFDHYVEPNQIDEILAYNENDVEITYKLYHHSRKEIQLRQNLTKKYGQNLMNESDSSIANKIMENDYAKATGQKVRWFKNTNTERQIVDFAEIVNDKVKFESNNLNQLLENIKSTKANKDTDVEFSVKINGTRHDIKKGGIHSHMPPEQFEAGEDTLIIEPDVQSYYPFNMINNHIKPAHLTYDIIENLKEYTIGRIKDKKLGNKIASAAKKIVIVSIFGKMGNPHHWLYDMKAMYEVTINGQLFLLMLIEQLEKAGFKTFYSNTDGVVSFVPKDKKTEFYQICTWWQNYTGFDLDYGHYDKCVIENVNNYLWKEADSDKIKYKGRFDINRWKDVTKSFDKPIVPLAVKEYFINNIEPKETIENHQDILDFCMAQKVGNKFDVFFDCIENNQLKTEKLQHTNRYYIAKGGGRLYKQKPNESKQISLAAGDPVALLNDVDSRDASNYPVKYQYYINEANKIISQFKYKQNDLFL